MKRVLPFFILGFIIHSCQFGEVEQSAPSQALWYTSPAKEWTDALPIGNGSLGGMVYGGAEVERIQFNYETLWTGGPRTYSKDSSYFYLDTIRHLLTKGEQQTAEDLAMQHFMGDPLRQQAYQPFGDIYISFTGHEGYRSYQRKLDLQEGIAVTEYVANGAGVRQEYLSSYPDNVMAIRFSSDQQETFNLSLTLSTPHLGRRITMEENRIYLELAVAMGAVRGCAVAEVRIPDGSIEVVGESLKITAASEVVILLTAATNVKSYDYLAGDAKAIATQKINKLTDKTFEEIRQNHVADYRSLYDRFSLSFGENERLQLPTDERISGFWKDAQDPGLVALYAQYARYLMIASSRPGTHPANLQGIWNDQLQPPWDSKWTTNINTEMNYWPAEVMNLAECHEPLFDLIRDCSITGRHTAREHYGADGWVLHHNTDIWRGTAPVNHANHGIWVSGGAWLTQHLWEHYQYSQDLDFLRETAYPMMKGAAEFFADFLVENEDGFLISTPSNSPEVGGLVAGPTMDHQIVRQLFRNCIQASKILDVDEAFRRDLEEMVIRIAPNRIGRLGQLQEWMEDKDDPEEHHRHVSHLWALHPGSEINWLETQELFGAARKSLEMRGDEGTGWSLAWKVNFWSRLLDGEHAFKLLHMLLSPAEHPGREIRGGSYPNLFDAHPPFQIDGNFGGAAGITEMLLQSHLGELHILPALPVALNSGSVKGLRARGGFEMDMSWEDGEVMTLEIRSSVNNLCRIRFKEKVVEFGTVAGGSYLMGRDFDL